MTSDVEKIHSFLEFCGCGMPEEAQKFLMKVLIVIDLPPCKDSRGLGAEWDAYCADLDKRRKELFTSVGAEYLMYYFMDEWGLTEHGGSVPGWLTGKGDKLLAMLRKEYEGKEDE